MTEELVLLSRRHCRLCELASSELQSVTAELGLSFSELDVDEDPRLRTTYTDRVPVLLHRGRALIEGRFDRSGLRARLLAAVGASGPLSNPVTDPVGGPDRG